MTDIETHKLPPLLQQHAKAINARFRSLADVGSSNRPAVEWFRQWQLSEEPHDYTAIDVDDSKLSELRARGLKTSNSLEDIDQHDLTIAKEVIEHIPADDSIEFLIKCEAKTGILFGLTTPNFEYWKNKRPAGEYKEMRFVPDHMKALKPGSANPHHHQQEMTKDSLTNYMQAAFPAPKWETFVYRAWPWNLQDLARGSEYKIYFKLMAIARRASA